MRNTNNPLVCCVMCTYGRFDIVEQSIGMFLKQDYENKKLVVFNTADVPLVKGDYLNLMDNVEIVNQPLMENGEPYRSLGDVRNESVKHAEGDVYICWDDDDLFLPWHITQGVKGLLKGGKEAWKPAESYWSLDGGKVFKGIMGNAMEASVLAWLDIVKEYGFSTERSGGEHVDGGWYDYVWTDTRCTIEEVSPFESYGYVWGDPRAPHKTSGHINDTNNFENHKKDSVDFGEGKLLTPPNFTGLDPFLRGVYEVWFGTEDGIKEALSRIKPSDLENLRDKIITYYEKYGMELPSIYSNDVAVKMPSLSNSVSLSNRKEAANTFGQAMDANFCTSLATMSSTPILDWAKGLLQDRYGVTEVRDGYFVEFGAVDGLHANHTGVLERDWGWKGLLIEGHTLAFEFLKKNRPDVTCVNEVIGEDGAEVVFLELEGIGKSGYGNCDHSRIYRVSPQGSDLDIRHEEPFTKKERRTSKSLERVLDENGAPSVIDFMVVDVEDGLDLALGNFNFDKYKVGLLAVEFHCTANGGSIDVATINHILDSGYVLDKVMEPTFSPDLLFRRKDFFDK